MTKTNSFYNIPEVIEESKFRFKINQPEGNIVEDGSNFRSSLYSLNIALESKFAFDFFNKDASRVIMATTQFALRKRSQDDTINSLNFPFMNLKAVKIKPQTSRNWFNTWANVDGIYIPELARKIKIMPITIEYEATIWLHRDDDMQYVFQKLSYDNAIETIVPYYINVAGQDMKMPSTVDYELSYEPEYKETDWLKKNSIHTITVNPSVQSLYIQDNLDICIPTKVLMEFAVNNQLDEEATSETLQFVIDKYAETVTASS